MSLLKTKELIPIVIVIVVFYLKFVNLIILNRFEEPLKAQEINIFSLVHYSAIHKAKGSILPLAGTFFRDHSPIQSLIS